MDAARLWLVVWTRFLVSQRTDPRRFFSLFFFPSIFKRFNRAFRIRGITMGMGNIYEEWQGVECRETLGHSRSECEKIRGHPRFRANGHWMVLRMITLFGIRVFSKWNCIFFLVNYFFIIKQEIWIINFGNIMLLIEIKRKKFWNDW